MKRFLDNKNDKKNLRYLCTVYDISEGKSKTFSISNSNGMNIEIALFNIEGKFYAISNRCVHEGGPLNEGILEGYVITCPWHEWKYSVIDGKAPHEGGDSVRSYEVKVIEDHIYVNFIIE
jgi:nitrite reductase/ring-hydroxylating ferredoxin subunit